MKLWIMSDLHQNADDKQLLPEQKPEHDVLILAGDISPSIVEARRYACTLTSKPSILVAGNHEFYGRCIDHELDALEAIEGYDETDFLKSLSSTLGEEHSFENEEFKDHVEMVSSRAHFLEKPQCYHRRRTISWLHVMDGLPNIQSYSQYGRNGDG